MKSLVQKAFLTGLGLVESGSKAAEKLGRELAQQAKLSEKEGEKLAKRLRERSEKAIVSLRKTMDAEVTKVVDMINGVIKESPVKVTTHHGKKKTHTKAKHHKRAK